MNPWLTIVGIGEDGELGAEARAALDRADLLVGGTRHLALVPAGRAARRAWPSPMLPLVEEILTGPRSAQVVVLASGDPMLHGVGATFTARLDAGEYRIIPQVSAFSLACARLGWPQADVTLVSAVGKSLDLMRVAVQPGRRLALYGAVAGEVAAMLTEMGYGPSGMVVFDRLGGPAEARRDGIAHHWVHPAGEDLAVVAVTCLPDEATRPLSTLAGLPDEAFDSDGQMTKREVRAATLARLAPLPGQLLWDVGAGTGTIGIEWSRAHPSCRAVAVERRADRAQRITANARTLGVPALRVVEGELPGALDGLPAPDAVFIGGGIGTPGLVDRCWAALKPGGRLVANVVTVTGEATLAQWHQSLGGDLIRIAVARARPVGGMLGWKSLAPVTQWAIVKP
ncbi:MAG TPA: precorrin-6y C5,15-methyltransferase (decarboxylating) subunit CbiE [Aliidongia sp.]|uniref:precorrin-6y C5,15-methyltransferase (decarboxylating) subunit CbiE n=1 Tax=Aliidongia sp. TaxID=1914230 RepID=UPI002DDDA029|nr:precorrin-6y C5,15-methyltransferase (decarboxylating) subunit CbiE [Aliidongia sp.]HEV2676499.1 precorrin-6y C5,15-methyltransferase (decarboxylating) subunit CbiE [Aliidongia sp.]